MSHRHTLPDLALALLFFLPNPGAGQTLPTRPLETSQPEHPNKAKERGIAGIVRFQAHVDERGRVRSVTIKSVPADEVGFEKATEKAVKKWRFDPALEGGRPIASSYEGTVRFRLGSDDEVTIEALLEQVSLKDDPNPGLVPKLEIRGEWETCTSVLEKWLDAAFGPSQRPMITLETFKLMEGRANVEVSAEGRSEGDLVQLSATKKSGHWFVTWAGEKSDQDPVLAYKPPPPAYPKAASKGRISGEVILEIVVPLDGSTEVIGVLKSPSQMLLEASVDHAAQWRWRPATKEGRPVEAVGLITVRFSLE